MYEVICTEYYPNTQIKTSETTCTIEETVWLCRTYLSNTIPLKILKDVVRKALYCEFVMMQYKNISVSIIAKLENEI